MDLINKLQKNIILLTLITFFIINLSTISTIHAQKESVRIGFFNSENYGYYGANGELTGYDVQLSKTIGMYGGFEAVMVGYDSVPEMEEDLRNGKVDILIDFLRTEKREEEFIFTNNSILEEQVVLYTRNAADALNADDIYNIDTIKIGYITGSGFLDYFQEFCDEKGINVTLSDYHDEVAMHAAMDNGETDACLTGSSVPVGYRVLVSAPPLSSYMMLRKEDEALRVLVDEAISQLKTDDPDYLSNLYKQHIGSHNTEMSPLTAQEKEYLTSHHVLSVGLVRGAQPFVIEKSDGSLSGIVPDYYKALEKTLNVEFNFVIFDDNKEAIQAVANGDVDILGHYYGNIIAAEKDRLYDTMSYGATECARLIRNDFDGEVKTASVTGRTSFLLSEQLSSDITLVSYPNLEDCYNALMRGEVDSMIGSMAGISWLINQHTMRGVSLSILSDIVLEVRGAVSAENQTLLFVLNKAIAVSHPALNEAILENAINGETNLLTALGNLPIAFTITAVSVLTLLVILLIVTLVLLYRNSKERVALLNREMNIDNLTDAGSRRYGLEMLNRELAMFRRYKDGPMIAMFDIDHFKEKNDTYGHEYGDYVLTKVVEILKNTLRESDMIIRWGGDEFILISPHINSKGADTVLKKVVQAIDDGEYLLGGKGEKITISVGASFFKQDDKDVNDVLRRCDNALYEAKSLRNTYRIHEDY